LHPPGKTGNPFSLEARNIPPGAPTPAVRLPRPDDTSMILRMVTALIRTMRPRQWAKNVFVFAALVFDVKLFVGPAFVRTLAGFVLLCLASSTIYLINDLADVEQDRAHPTKRLRPIASGELSMNAARTAAVVLGSVTLVASYVLHAMLGHIVLAYIVINLLYSYRLKHIPIIDVLIVAAGFVLRVAAGVSLIHVQRFSPWLYVVTTLGALFIGFGKRRAEMIMLQDEANVHRRVLDGYTIAYLDQLLVIVSATTIIAYSLYTFSAENLPANHLMMLTIPFVVYGVFRYLYLIHVEDAGGAPEELFFSDRPLMATILLWGLAAVGILYLGSRL
jgi:4-hydroxybenzoate polyprenyltransferase